MDQPSNREKVRDFMIVLAMMCVGLALTGIVTLGVVLGIATFFAFFWLITPALVEWTAAGAIIGSLASEIQVLRTGGNNPVSALALCAVPLLLGTLYGLRRERRLFVWAMS